MAVSHFHRCYRPRPTKYCMVWSPREYNGRWTDLAAFIEVNQYRSILPTSGTPSELAVRLLLLWRKTEILVIFWNRKSYCSWTTCSWVRHLNVDQLGNTWLHSPPRADDVPLAASPRQVCVIRGTSACFAEEFDQLEDSSSHTQFSINHSVISIIIFL